MTYEIALWTEVEKALERLKSATSERMDTTDAERDLKDVQARYMQHLDDRRSAARVKEHG